MINNTNQPGLVASTTLDEAGQIGQFQAQLADLKLKIEQLTNSRDQARDQADRLLEAYNSQAAELVYTKCCSRAWKQAAKRWRHDAIETGVALDHTAVNFEDLYGEWREKNDRLRERVQYWKDRCGDE